MPTVKKLCWEEMKTVTYVERIGKLFPCLEELELWCWSKQDPERLRGLRMDNLQQLTISCDGNFSEHHFVAFANLSLKLKRLTVHDTNPGGKKMRGLNIFLKSVAGTLTEMSLNGNEQILEGMRSHQVGRGPNNFTRTVVGQASPFPIYFPNLQKLEISCGILTDLKTIDYMPKLRKLKCKFQDWRGWWHLLNKNGMPNTKLDGLSKLRLGAIDSGCLLKMAPYFQSVTKLDVGENRIDDVVFRTICQTMRQLSHLRISQSANGASNKLYMTETGITGISSEELKELVDKLPDKEADADKVKGKRKMAYIGDLTALYNLELGMSRVEMTDLADVSLGVIVDIPSLSVLEMHKNSGVPPEVVAALKAKKKDLVFNLYSDLTTGIFAW